MRPFALAAYLATNRPNPKPTEDQMRAAVVAYFAANPIPPGKDGKDATAAQIEDAASTWLTAHPPAAGKDATIAQISDAAAAWLTAHPPAAGMDATTAQIADAVAAYITAHPPAAGKDGKNLTSALVGEITFGQSALVVIAGIRTLDVTLAGAKKGEPLVFIPTVLPDGYAVPHVRCPALDTKLKLTVDGPALTVLTSYSITGGVYRLT